MGKGGGLWWEKGKGYGEKRGRVMDGKMRVMMGKGEWLWVGKAGEFRVEKGEGKGWVMGVKKGRVTGAKRVRFMMGKGGGLWVGGKGEGDGLWKKKGSVLCGGKGGGKMGG